MPDPDDPLFSRICNRGPLRTYRRGPPTSPSACPSWHSPPLEHSPSCNCCTTRSPEPLPHPFFFLVPSGRLAQPTAPAPPRNQGAHAAPGRHLATLAQSVFSTMPLYERPCTTPV